MTIQAMPPTEIDALHERVTQLEHQLARQEQTVLALQENEARLHSVLNNLTDAPYRRNLCTDRYDYLSPVMEQLTGWTVEEMNQADIATVLARIHPDDLPLVQEEIERTHRLCQEVGRATGVLEYRFRTQAGDYCWLDDHLTVMAGDDGQPLYRLGVVRDITERKQAEETQQESLAKLEHLFEILPVGISVLNHQRQVVKQNPALENIIGLSAEEVVRGEYRQRRYIRPDGTTMPPEEFASARVIRGEPSALNVETGIVKEDGTVTWTSVSAAAVPFSDWSAVIVTQDITAKKQAEQALETSQQNLTALIENTDASIWSVDTQYRMIVGNQLYYRNVSAAIGRSLIPGENVLSLPLPPVALDEWRGYYDRALAGETFSTEASTRFAEEIHTVEYRFNPIRTPEGQITGVTVLGRDITERKRVEEERAHLAARLELATRAAGMGIWDWDIQQNILVWDEQMYALYGRQKHQFAGAYEAWLQGVHPDDRAASDEVSVRARRSEGDYDTEFRVVWPDGSIRWLHATGQVFRDSSGQAERMIGVNYDITERKLAAEVLERTRHTLAEAQKIAHLGSFEYVAATRMTVWSEEEYRIYGLDPAEPSPTYEVMLEQCLPPDDATLLHETFTRAIQSLLAYEFEHRIVRPDGSIRWVYDRARPYLDQHGNLLRYIGITLDITERKQAEEALRQSEARYRLISENTADVIWVLDPRTGRFTYVSPSVEKLRGYTPAEVMAQPVTEALTPASLQEVSESLAVNLPAFIAQGARTMSFINKVDQPRKDASIVNTEVTTTYLFNEQGEVEIVGVSRDITDRKRAEEELYRTLEELRRSNAELEQFAYVASHDLQEPLRTVAGMVQLLQKQYRGQLDEDADEYIGLAVEGANRMKSLINDLLTYSRVSRRGKPFEPVRAGTCLQQALRNLEVSISENQATITCDDLPTINADPTQLTQLFQNLIGNALKFRGDQIPQIHISAREVERAWQFSVRDNGIGIEPQYFERIFQVFQRLHLREEYPGTGIGLALCQKIVERHGGKIWVESQPGQGSTFYFTLPRS